MVPVELDDAVALRVGDVVREDDAAGGVGVLLQRVAQPGAVEDVVAQNQADLVGVDEIRADDEGVREPARFRLDGVLEPAAQPAAVAEELAEAVLVLRGGDDQNLADSRGHQG